MQDVGTQPVDRRWLLWLTGLAVASRLVWNLWVHPPGEYVFSDMAHYMARAKALAESGFTPGVRSLAWQTYGTHYLLAVAVKLFGARAPYVGAGLVWAGMGAAVVPLSYLLACRATVRRWIPPALGVVTLVWVPLISNGGFFLAETPFACLQLWGTYWLVVFAQEGRRGLGAGIVFALAFAVRPQIAIFLVLALVAWVVRRRAGEGPDARALLRVVIPLLVVGSFSAWRFNAHTGEWIGVAENANMNLTAGRCHNIVTQAFPTEGTRDASNARGSTTDGRRVSLPGFRILAQLPAEHPFALRPALEHESIKLVGYIGDARAHREIRRECYAKTGVAEQLRYSVVNVSLLWFWAYQWPEISDEKAPRSLFDATVAYRELYQWLFWLPSLLGVVWFVREPYRRGGNWVLGLSALQLLVSLGVAAIFFGTIRLRLPYDPFALLLALVVWDRLYTRLKARKST